jgi:hypothetical protein
VERRHKEWKMEEYRRRYAKKFVEAQMAPRPRGPPVLVRAYALARGYVFEKPSDPGGLYCILHADCMARLVPGETGGLACPGGHVTIQTPNTKGI